MYIKFSTKEGYLLNYYPLLKINIKNYSGLDFSKDSFKINEVEVKLNNIKGKKYINTEKPIVIPFEVSTEAKRGEYTLTVAFEGFLTNVKEKYAIKFVNKVYIDYKIY